MNMVDFIVEFIVSIVSCVVGGVVTLLIWEIIQHYRRKRQQDEFD